MSEGAARIIFLVWVGIFALPLVSSMASEGSVGPTWKWLVGILLVIIGSGFGWWMTSVWTQLGDLSSNVNTMKLTLAEISQKLGNDHDLGTSNTTQIQKLWERYATDHEVLMKQQVEVDADHELLHNWIHPDHNRSPEVR